MNSKIVLATVFLLLALPGAAAAATIHVTTTVDDYTNNGNCTLREAIRAASIDSPRDSCVSGSGDDVILLSADVYTLSIAGADENINASGDLDIVGAGMVTIRGAGMNETTIDANGIDRVFHVPFSNARLTLEDLRITGGDTSNGGTLRSGGCLYSSASAAETHLLRVLVEGCTAAGPTSAGGEGFRSKPPRHRLRIRSSATTPCKRLALEGAAWSSTERRG